MVVVGMVVVVMMMMMILNHDGDDGTHNVKNVTINDGDIHDDDNDGDRDDSRLYWASTDEGKVFEYYELSMTKVINDY